MMIRTAKTLFLLIKHKRVLLPLINSYAFFLENKQDTIWGSLSGIDREEVERLVREAAEHGGPIIEIGTLFGFTTQLMAACKRPGQKLITIDNFSWNPFALSTADHREFTRRSLHYCLKHSDVTLFEGTSELFFKDYDGMPPALIFIDAAHDYESVKHDIELASGSAPNVLSGHDYTEISPGVVKAVNETLGKVSVRGCVWSSSPRFAS